MVYMYTDGSIMGEERGVGVYCEAKALREDTRLRKMCQSAELKAIEIATNFIFQQDKQKAAILTDTPRLL
jgi:hypothetical protein